MGRNGIKLQNSENSSFFFFVGAVAFWGAGFRGSCLRFFRRQSLAVPLPCNCLTGFSQLRVMLTGVSDKHFVFDKVWENTHAKTLKKKNLLCRVFFPSFDSGAAWVHGASRPAGPTSWGGASCHFPAFAPRLPPKPPNTPRPV